VFVEITHHTSFCIVAQARSMKHFTDWKNQLARWSSCLQVCQHYLVTTLVH